MIPLRDNVPARRYPTMTIALILLNVFVFGYESWMGTSHLKALSFEGALFPALFSSLFWHENWLYLIGNMWVMCIFADNVEDRMGPLRFLVFFLLCGMAGISTYKIADPANALSGSGANAALAGVLGAYLVSFPFARISILVPLLLTWPVIEIPALFVLGFWFSVHLLIGTGAFTDATSLVGGLSWWTQVGGFLAGILFVGPFSRRPVRRYIWQ